MVTRRMLVQNVPGFHARPISTLIDEKRKFQSKVTIRKGEASSDLEDMMALLKMQCRYGDEIHVTCEGEDEQACLEALAALIETKLGEQ
jgi:Phosphotransferase System HPr (HPr) Family